LFTRTCLFHQAV